jgi:hypothetical protein
MKLFKTALGGTNSTRTCLKDGWDLQPVAQQMLPRENSFVTAEAEDSQYEGAGGGQQL